MTFPELPILTRELRASLRKRPWWWMAFMALIVASVPLVLTHIIVSAHNRHEPIIIGEEDCRNTLTGVWMLGAFILCFVVPPIVGPALAQEHERQTLESLLLTRLSGTRIAIEKMLRALAPIGVAVVYSLPFGLAYALDARYYLPQFLQMIGLMVLTGLLISAVSLYAGTFYRRTYAAVIAAFMVNAAVFVPLPVLVTASFERYYFDVSMGHLAAGVLCAAPFVGLLLLWGMAEGIALLTRSYPDWLVATLPRVLFLVVFTATATALVTAVPAFATYADLLLLGNPMSGVIVLTNVTEDILAYSWIAQHPGIVMAACYLCIALATAIITRQAGRRIDRIRIGG